MELSVNTNVASIHALSTLLETNENLFQAQRRVTSGLRVEGPQDNPASYSIAARMLSDVAGFEAVKIGLGLADAAVGAAITAGEAIKDLLIEMKAKAIQAQSDTLEDDDRTALDDEVKTLQTQIDSIVASAAFNGTNLIEKGAADLSVLADPDGNGKIDVAAQSLDRVSLGLVDDSGDESVEKVDLKTGADEAEASAALIETAINTVTNALARFGNAAKQLDVQYDFIEGLMDQTNIGVGSLVDADMALESALLESMQIKQELAVQSLGIANASPQILLSLYDYDLPSMR